MTYATYYIGMRKRPVFSRYIVWHEQRFQFSESLWISLSFLVIGIRTRDSDFTAVPSIIFNYCGHSEIIRDVSKTSDVIRMHVVGAYFVHVTIKKYNCHIFHKILLICKGKNYCNDYNLIIIIQYFNYVRTSYIFPHTQWILQKCDPCRLLITITVAIKKPNDVLFLIIWFHLTDFRCFRRNMICHSAVWCWTNESPLTFSFTYLIDTIASVY